MLAARNLPLDSSLKFSILLAVPSCCTFTMLHYGSLSAGAQEAAMIEPELEPSPEQSVTIPEQSAPMCTPAASIPPAATSPADLAVSQGLYLRSRDLEGLGRVQNTAA